jgi:hypothetical protein
MLRIGRRVPGSCALCYGMRGSVSYGIQGSLQVGNVLNVVVEPGTQASEHYL